MGDGRREDGDDVAYRTAPSSPTPSALGLPSGHASAAPAGAGEKRDTGEDTIQQPNAVGSLGPQLAQHLAAAVARAAVDPCAGSAAGLVRMASAGFRLEGWALWSQLATIAALLTRWRAHPPSAANENDAGPSATGAPSADDTGVEDLDGDIRERADAAWDAGVRRARLRMPTPADMVEECVAAEVALACGLSQSRAADRVLAADLILLDGKLPRTARLLQAGLLDWPKIQLLTHRLGVGTDAVLARLVERTLIPDEDLAALDALQPVLDDRVDAAPLPQVTRMTLPGLAAAIEATIAALDAEAAAERAKAARDRRCVSTRMDPDGMGRLEASTGAEQVAAMWSALTAAARQAKRGGDGRTLDQLRLDELVTRVTGLQTTDRSSDRVGPESSLPERPRPEPSGANSPPGARAAFGGEMDDDLVGAGTGQGTGTDQDTGADQNTGSGENEGRRDAWSAGVGGAAGAGGAAFALTLPLTTFLEIADDPGILDGYGPIAGALARQIARDAARLNPRTTTWRCVVVDDEHHTVLGVGRPVSTPKHDPPSRLADLVRRVHPFCVFPGCRVPAARCDIDHRVPYPGGATCSCTLQPLCRAHHRLKTAGLIAVHADPTDRTDHTERNNPTDPSDHGPTSGSAGTSDHIASADGRPRPPHRWIWTTSAGLTYGSRTPPATPPPSPPDLQPLLDLRRDRRAADRTLLAWVNPALRAAYRRGRWDEAEQTVRLAEDAMAAEVRHHDYGEILARNDASPAEAPPVPEPADDVPEPPRWLARLPLPALTDFDAEQDDAEPRLACSA